jgi:hypothetical protein
MKLGSPRTLPTSPDGVHVRHPRAAPPKENVQPRLPVCLFTASNSTTITTWANISTLQYKGEKANQSYPRYQRCPEQLHLVWMFDVTIWLHFVTTAHTSGTPISMPAYHNICLTELNTAELIQTCLASWPSIVYVRVLSGGGYRIVPYSLNQGAPHPRELRALLRYADLHPLLSWFLLFPKPFFCSGN